MKAQPNVARLNELMDRDGLDALVVRSGENFTYLTGIVYPGTLGRHLDLTGSVRSPVLIWPRNGKPEIVLNDFALGYTHLVSDMALVEYPRVSGATVQQGGRASFSGRVPTHRNRVQLLPETRL